MNCNCGHSQAAHHRTSTGECAFCSCLAYSAGTPEPHRETKDEPDEVKSAIERLAQHPAFAGLDPALLGTLTQRGKRRTILRDAVIMDKGDASDRLYLLLRGEVEVTREAHGVVPELSATLGPGDIVGEVGLLHGARHTATVVALDDVHALELTQEDVRAVMREHPDLRLAFMRMVHHRLQPRVS
ncbi:MAG TPA: cyclic nucleotide-binding domain-containing protein [Chloroflexota bacterium]|nr:cyclic nucleotide-binding domain-containing protein [Chloroflexota bacterium]